MPQSTWRKRIFWAIALAVSAFTIYQNLSAPEAKVTAFPIASVADYNRLLRNKGVEESDLDCPCSNDKVLASSFASIRLPASSNMTTNICGTLTKLWSIFGFTQSSSGQFCTPDKPWGRTEGTSLANCKACLAQMSAAWPANLTDDRLFNTVAASYPFATPSGRVFLETVLPVLQRPCATLYKTQLLAAFNFNSFMLPASLLHTEALQQLVLQYALSQVSQLTIASNGLRQQLPLLALSQPQPSNLSWNATRANLPQCDCQTLRSECNAFRFMPAFNDLPATVKERTNEDNDDTSFTVPVNPLWSCNPLASAVDMFPSELFNMTTSRLLNSLGIPKSEECAAVFETQNGPGGGGWGSGWYSRIYDAGANFPYTVQELMAGGWVTIDFEKYFATCRPSQCTVVEDGDLSANWWLFLILTLAAIHMWLSVLHFAFEHATSAAALLCACCPHLRGLHFQRVSTRDTDEAGPDGTGEKPPAPPPPGAIPGSEEGGGPPFAQPASALLGAADVVDVHVSAISPPLLESLCPSSRSRSASGASHGSRASHGPRALSGDTDAVASSWLLPQQLGTQSSSAPGLAGFGGAPEAAQRRRSSSAASRSSRGSRASSAFEEDLAVGLLANDEDAAAGAP
jgi:hypothetical protein